MTRCRAEIRTYHLPDDALRVGPRSMVLPGHSHGIHISWHRGGSYQGSYETNSYQHYDVDTHLRKFHMFYFIFYQYFMCEISQHQTHTPRKWGGGKHTLIT